MKTRSARATWSVTLVVLAMALLGCSAPSFRAATVAHGSLRQDGDVWIMALDGTPAERGQAAGELVGEQIRWALPHYLRETLKTAAPRGYVLELVRELAAGIPPEHLAQLDALAKAAQIDRDTLLVVNLSPEVYAGLEGCSCMGVSDNRAPDGVVRLARNLDWHGGEVLKDLGLVVIESGASHRFASITWPGLVGVVSGMNDQGLAVANLVVMYAGAKPVKGLPIMFALRRVLETQVSVDSATELLKSIDRTVPQNFALADPQSTVVLETSRVRFRRRDPVNGFLAVANSFDEDKRTQPNGRFVRMMRAGSQRVLGLAELKAALAEVAIPDMNVQALIFEPAARVVHGSTRARPAAKGEYWTLDLAKWLRVE